jgi:2,4-dienoyl-CoA reductase-like NADH-dependent reductase (Old Yellow Enzyme family)/thioredoxin reductase
MTALPRLFAPITLGGVALRNRIVLTGHGTGMGRDLAPDDRMVAYYAERARGGVALIMLGSQQVHPTSPGVTGLICCYDDSVIPALRRIADAVHAHGARIFGYLSHMGLATTARPLPLWSASAVHEQKYGEVAHAMTEAELAEITAAFAAAARRNLAAGMDGIEVHCGHGLLLQQFLSPLTNKRSDRYGGSAENRARFPCEVLEAVRASIGDSMPLGIRISADELIEGGLALPDMQQMVRLLVAAGRLDFVDVSAGHDGDLVSNMLHEPPMGLPPAPFAELARGIRAAAGVPVIHGTRIADPQLAERLLAEQTTDLIGMCRPLIADPFLPEKARAGRFSAITPCVGCEQACFGRLHRGRHISCVGNPRAGREIEWPAPGHAATPRRVLVVGGGPAGMEAALVAARRGHRVTLYEAQEALGGRLRLAASAPTRGEWRNLIAHKAAMLDDAGVELRLGAPADRAAILAQPADAVIIATGAEPGRGGIDGADLPHVATTDEVLAGRRLPGAHVAIIDLEDRMPAATVALTLSEAGHRVTIVTRAPMIGHRLESQNFTFMHREFFRRSVALLPHHAVRRIEPDALLLHNAYTRAPQRLAGVDAVVVAAPGAPRDGLANALAGHVKLHVAGDCYTPRDVEAAIFEGHRAGMSV